MWSLHPRLLDRAALVACWRETLLAQKVLTGQTRGYRNHPQLQRFKTQPDPLAAIGTYLAGLHAESRERGYKFDATKILKAPTPVPSASYDVDVDIEKTYSSTAVPLIPVTEGQLAYELGHLNTKIISRAPADLWRIENEAPVPAHPLFTVVPGGVEPWERTG